MSKIKKLDTLARLHVIVESRIVDIKAKLNDENRLWAPDATYKYLGAKLKKLQEEIDQLTDELINEI